MKIKLEDFYSDTPNEKFITEIDIPSEFENIVLKNIETEEDVFEYLKYLDGQEFISYVYFIEKLNDKDLYCRKYYRILTVQYVVIQKNELTDYEIETIPDYCIIENEKDFIKIRTFATQENTENLLKTIQRVKRKCNFNIMLPFKTFENITLTNQKSHNIKYNKWKTLNFPEGYYH